MKVCFGNCRGIWPSWREVSYALLEENHKLPLALGDFFDDLTQYRRLIGRLIYLSPESYAVHVLSQFMQAPCVEHFQAACRVHRYIKGSLGLGILLRANSDL